MNMQKISVSLGEIFGLEGAAGVKVSKFAEKRPGVPQVKDFSFEPSLARDVVAFLECPIGDGLYIFGPTGCGKSETVRQACARLNWPMTEFTGSGTTEMAELFGHLALKNGSMIYEDGPLVRAMRLGHVFVLNEMDLMRSSELMGINDLLSTGSVTIPELGGEVVTAHPDFRFVATGNTAGGGDENGDYIGVRAQNVAFMDRFRLSKAGYRNLKDEIAIVSRFCPELPIETVRVLCRTAKAVRRVAKGFGGETMSITVSTRALKRWAALCLFFKGAPDSMKYALRSALLYRGTAPERIAIERILEEEEARVKAGIPDDEAEFEAFYDAKEEALINGTAE